MKTISPASLEELCLSCISENIEELCHEDVIDICGFPFERLTFDSPLLLHEQLAENIIKILSCNGKLTTMTASLFINPKTCRIRKFYLEKCRVESTILKLLFSKHRVIKLDLRGTTMISSSLLFELLNGMSSTVRELNLSDTSFVLDFSTVWPMKNLTHLDISNTPVDDKAMSMASQCLDCLECVNISNTEICETVSFGNLRGQLKILLAYNAPIAWKNPIEFKNFVSLQKLDISRKDDRQSYSVWFPDAAKLQKMLADQEMMPDLVYLDISGSRNLMECVEQLKSFLSCHSKLQFLGLCMTELSSHEVIKSLSSCIEVTGDGNEQWILSSLRAYPDRASYMGAALRGLFHISKNWTEKPPEVLQLVLSPMKNHPEDLHVQMAATACMFNIIRGGGTEADIHPTYLSKIAALVLTAMRTFPEKPDVLRNCLLILESRQILKKARMNYFEVTSQAMDALCHFSSDENITRLATKLCAILSSKISTQETLALGSERNIKIMFDIAQEKIAANQADYVLSVTLSVSWNLTDEAPSTCLLFVHKGGLQMMAQALKVFREGTQELNIIIKKKLLGTLNNIAEVPSLRQYLITDEFMDLFGSLLEDGLVELSYFCGGILSNVMLDWSDNIMLLLCTKQHMLHKLEQAVKSWELPAEELVAYRSFNPFLPLLHCSMPAVQMWALWGIHHVCSRNGPRYIPLVVDSGIMKSVQEIWKTSFNGVSELAQKLISTVTNFQSSGK
ncbi:protein zyg-11 homolog [Oculina patagonica]